LGRAEPKDFIATATDRAVVIDAWKELRARLHGEPHARARREAMSAMEGGGVTRCGAASRRSTGVRLAAVAAARVQRGTEVWSHYSRADAALIEAGFIDLQIGAVSANPPAIPRSRSEPLRPRCQSPIRETRPLLLADRGGKQFGSGIEAEGSHGQ